MTMIDQIDVNCPVCNENIKISIVLSTNSTGSSDLDLRPPEMERSTMYTWTQECPYCGYVSDDFNEKTEITKEFLENKSYKNCDDIEFMNSLAKIFYREFLIASENNNLENQFYGLLHCAWACDDCNDFENAIIIRNKCLNILKEVNLNETMDLVKLDIMRRSHHFDEVIEEYKTKQYNETLLNQIREFQIEKAKKHDDECYTIEDVITS